MNHYPHHIGDFNSATRHLSRLERSVYRDMLDMYYDTETALDGSDMARLAKRLLCNTDEEMAALQYVLSEFFEHQDDGRFVHHRCERVVAEYQAQQVVNVSNQKAEKTRQDRSRAKRAAISSALREAGVSFEFNATMAKLLALCKQHGVQVPRPESVTPSVTAHAVTRHAPDTAKPEPKPKPITTPQPPSGGAGADEAAQMGDWIGQATKLAAFFPEQRRTRLVDVALELQSIVVCGVASAQDVLQAAGRQASQLTKEEGKACPSVLRWLRERRWVDAQAVGVASAGVPADWRSTRTGIEAMGERVGLGPWNQERWRLLSQYADAVQQLLDASADARVVEAACAA